MKPELLSPAGSPEALRAAVQNGADAVYLGWGEFNARRNAKNFSDQEFAQALRDCHVRGVNVYLTLNTLVTDRELPQVLETAKRASALGVDAVLVQDWGLFALLHAVLPDLPLHASTQMSLFTSGGACEAAALGMERVVLARECSREDTAAICRNCPAEVEVFIHGALCMCYSGQCAMSALIGGRSGNRGSCAQPCRLPYGVDRPAKGGHPLSLKDYCLAKNLDEMAQMGVACLKLEGRMKRPEYVAVVTRIYARLLKEHRGPTSAESVELEQAFSRSGFTDWYWQGRRGKGMFGVRPEAASEPQELFAQAKAAYEKENLRTVPVRFVCRIAAGVPVSLTASDFDGHTVTAAGPVPEPARTRAVTAWEISDRLKKTGGTAYRCESAEVTAEEGLALSAAAVNALRREALTAMTEARCAVPERRVLPSPPLPEEDCRAETPRLTISAASLSQITPALLNGVPARIAVPLECFDSAVSLPDFGGEWCAILPRVWRDREEPVLHRLLERAISLGVTGVFIGNLGHLPLVRDLKLHRYGDFGLNVFNSRSLAFLRERGLESATASFELRFAQLRDLKKLLPTEGIIYGRLPLMITENCLIQNALGCFGGNDPMVQRCSDKPCAEPHFLADRTGARFPLLPAFGHRTEIENSKPLYLADRDDWRRLGLAFARLRFTTESPEECARIVEAYLCGAHTVGAFTRGLYDRGVE